MEKELHQYPARTRLCRGGILLSALLLSLQLGHTGLAAQPEEDVLFATPTPVPSATPSATQRNAGLPAGRGAANSPAVTPKSTPTPTATLGNTPKPSATPAGTRKNTPQPTATPTTTPGQGAAQQDGAATLRGNLLLVNWEHPYRGGGVDLVRMDSVIDKGLIGMRNSHLINKTAGQAANLMFRAGKEEEACKFVVDNVYRSVKRQDELWQKRLRRNGSDYGEDPYADPVKVLPGGMSEHATGLAMDIFAKSYQKSNAGFADTKEGKWLAQNAHRFGFILRYPADKEHITGVIYEPWHFRYVGVEHAAAMYKQGLCLEEYTNKGAS